MICRIGGSDTDENQYNASEIPPLALKSLNIIHRLLGTRKLGHLKQNPSATFTIDVSNNVLLLRLSFETIRYKYDGVFDRKVEGSVKCFYQW
jgi:hypothetical protein